MCVVGDITFALSFQIGEQIPHCEHDLHMQIGMSLDLQPKIDIACRTHSPIVEVHALSSALHQDQAFFFPLDFREHKGLIKY